MFPFSARRILTALTLILLLCAAPALALAPARTARTAHVVEAPTQIGILEAFQNAIVHFIAKCTNSHDGGQAGGDAGPRIDPEGAPIQPDGNP